MMEVNLKKGILSLFLCIFISSGRAQFPSRYYQYSSQLHDLPHCPYPGYSADPWNCTRFFRCVDYGTEETALFLRHDFSCAPGTVFDPSISVCNHPDQVNVGQTAWCRYQVQAELDKLKTPDYYSWGSPHWNYHQYQRQLQQLQRQRERERQQALLARQRQRQRQYQRPRPSQRQQKRLRYDDDDDDEENVEYDYNGVSPSSRTISYLNSEETGTPGVGTVSQQQNFENQRTRPRSKTNYNKARDSTEEPEADTTAFVYHRRPFFQYQVQIPYIRGGDH